MINTWDNYYDASIVLQKENLITNHFNDSISNEKLKAEVAIFLARSNNWKNVFDPTTGFMRALKNSTFYFVFIVNFVASLRGALTYKAEIIPIEPVRIMPA